MSKKVEDIKIDKIIRSKRKTISLEVIKDGNLVVRAPYLVPHSQIESLVRSKEIWIRKKQEMVRVRSQVVSTKKYVNGEMFWYLGNSYVLELINDQEEPLVLKHRFYLDGEFQNKGRIIFEDWYKNRASEVINNRVRKQARRNGFSFSRVRITSAKTRWGSCGPKGSLNFTWRLVMAPLEVVDFVVVHELVHLKIRNHSKKYWNELSALMPDYEQYRLWLKENGHRLTLD